MELRGANAIITGASRGIGVFIARALGREGVNLVLAARSQEELSEVCAELQALSIRAVAVCCDVTSADDRADLIRRAEAEFGSVDILVNNAGIDLVSRFDQAPESNIIDTLAVNLEAPMLLARAVVPGMLERGRGHVVNIASGAGKVGVP